MDFYANLPRTLFFRFFPHAEYAGRTCFDSGAFSITMDSNSWNCSLSFSLPSTRSMFHGVVWILFPRVCNHGFPAPPIPLCLRSWVGILHLCMEAMDLTLVLLHGHEPLHPQHLLGTCLFFSSFGSSCVGRVGRRTRLLHVQLQLPSAASASSWLCASPRLR